MNAMQFGGAPALSLLLAACGERQNGGTENKQAASAGPTASQADQVYSATGKVTSIAADQVTIAHGPGRGYRVACDDHDVPRGIAGRDPRREAGDQVSFAFRQDGSAYALTSLRKR